MLILFTYQLVEDAKFLEFYQEYKPLLPKKLIEKIDAFKFPIDQQRSLIADLMVRKFYSQALNYDWNKIDYYYNEHEKPYLLNSENQCFNISHSGNQIVVAFSNENIGVDIEKIKGDRRNIAKRFFTPEEIMDMNSAGTKDEQIKYFFQLWTLKESYMKAIGKGISMSLSSFAFKKEDNRFVLDFSDHDQEWFFQSTFWENDYFLSICSKANEEPDIQRIILQDLLNFLHS